jgi:hypothetical protein
MKVTVQVDCSPEEARAFLGLPDVQPIQKAFMQDMETRMQINLQAMNPETIMKTWLPANMQGFEQWQKMFWSQVQQALSSFAGATGNVVSLPERKSASGE